MGRGVGGKLRVAGITLSLLIVAAPAQVAGQIPPVADQPGRVEIAGPLLPGRHWAVEAAWRLHALGLLADYLPAQRSVPLESVEWALREAARHAPVQKPELTELVLGWHARLLEEFPALASSAAEPFPGAGVIGAHAALGVGSRRGAAAPGYGEYEPERTGTVELPDENGASLYSSIGASLYLGEHVGVDVGGRLGSRISLERLEVAAVWRGWRVGAGRVPVGYGGAPGAGVVLGGEAPLDLIQLSTLEPFELPSLLAAAGPVSLHTFFGRMFESRHAGHPFSWGASVQVQPHWRVTLGAHRAALFGGEGEDRAVTIGKVVDMLIGRVAGIGFENQIVSASARVALPTEGVLPLTAYLEWGSEDAAGAWFDVPGRVVGISAPALPPLPALHLGAEYAHFGGSCCGNPSWYRHWSFPGSWAARDRPLGHALGGEGTERSLHLGADLLEGRLRLRGRSFRRFRGGENLYAPERAGISRGMGVEASWRPARRWEVRAAGGGEWGRGWSERDFRIEGKVF